MQVLATLSDGLADEVIDASGQRTLRRSSTPQIAIRVFEPGAMKRSAIVRRSASDRRSTAAPGTF